MRAQLRDGRPVVLQVMYRFLSGRERSDYWAMTFVAITGYIGDGSISSDPIDTPRTRFIPDDLCRKSHEGDGEQRLSVRRVCRRLIAFFNLR